MAHVEVEGPDSGWVATLGFDASGDVRVLESLEGWEADLQVLIAQLLQEPSPDGGIPGGYPPGSEDTLYDLATSLGRRKPECRGERLVGYVVGGSRILNIPAQ